ncbi:MAG: hypothetical protein ACFFD1_13425, partial [Candidatus Thorarchaeota archaeon]
MSFIEGIFQRDICNLHSAEKLIYQTIKETSIKGPYGLLLKSMIALSDVYHQKHILTGNNIYLDNMESILNQADEIGYRNPIFPTILFIKVYKAILASSKRQWDLVDNILQEIFQYISDQSKLSLKESILSIAEQ